MLDEFRTFVAIARWGTFALAAERVGLSPAAVSGHIKRLEDHLRMPLFDRTGRSATVNAAGARLLPRVQAILDSVDNLLEPDADPGAGTLRVGSIGSLQSATLSQALSKFRETYPHHGVHVAPGLSLHLIEQVDSGEMDLALVTHPPFPLPPEFTWYPLHRESYFLLAHADHPGETWEDVIRTQPFIGYHRLSSGGRRVNRFLRRLPFIIKPAMEMPMQAMINAVRSGLGVALVPLSPGADLPGLRILPLDNDDLFREIGIIRSQIDLAEPAVDHLTACLIEASQQA
ncbi:LysR family transcriptional regulator [Novosphingobium flavum]|uniref:LysR family transcriptional regulator n=1 Tax=Novosphingobium flavum TaxID=1778672 RepID=A0A7X1FSF6_9SPHN|nr:LysR family transcriptional regulator [Novosphingobium flavum]MBC2666113.1 LysR family transcriptional regulator [Novosphingobium flavum]